MSERSLRTPLSRVTGLGSARGGTHHWWMQRVTAVAMVPLTFWFVVSIAGLSGASREVVVSWLAQPLPALVMLLFIGFGFFHLRLGLQVVIEDYVHLPAAKVALLLLNLFFCVAVGGAAALAVLTMLFRG
jgi:succinate dehydrogenase / fumarate reductase, membrane anchor subunit